MSLLPDWLVKILQGMGVEGAIIFVLLTMLSGAITTIVILLKHSNKVYGYRLEERDKLNEVLSNTARVLGDILKVTEERNQLTSEQADLLREQTVEFVVLKATVLGQFEAIKNNHAHAMDTYKASVEAVSKMADALRVIHDLVLNNRQSVAEHIQSVRQQLADAREALHQGHATRTESLVAELRRLLGDVTVIKRRRITDSRPGKKG